MFTLQSIVHRKKGDTQPIELQMDCCVAAGYTGRNQQSVKAHIDELKELGVATPYAIPAMYWISPFRLQTADFIVVVGSQTSPEVEFFLAGDKHNEFYITVASDHTDRELESVSVGKSKQVCDKILGDVFWKVAEVEDHWDEICLRSEVIKNGKWEVYQEGTFAQILHYTDILRHIENEEFTGKSPSFLSGTLPLLTGETIFTSACKISLIDPVLNRDISKTYTITTLPDRS